MRPRIGITSSGTPGVKYVAAVEAAGGKPVVLRNDPRTLDEQLRAIDGLVLSGGPDVAPAAFDARPHPATKAAKPERDAFELAAARVARERGLPTLCICRGLQVANVAFGGTLIQDLPDEKRLSNHYQTEYGFERARFARDHVVHVDERSALARLLGTTEFETNSMHHQAIAAPAPGLRVVATTADGTIEAVDADFRHPFFYAVQWHPEELPDDPVSKKLFGGLIAAAAQPKSRTRVRA
ncbi:MAG: gamma-glutamyl-gamma-aminobutyrate hydrolase family protein [Candidatus Eremiobacteraeota bacterium]|nr:gamma-glutamyl-gamma-aminobutyrate hydrolase family protein [Candidatus Eremiobacteraeota bacterium]